MFVNFVLQRVWSIGNPIKTVSKNTAGAVLVMRSGGIVGGIGYEEIPNNLRRSAMEL